MDSVQKIEIFKIYISDLNNNEYYVEYFDKYVLFLRKNTFKNLSKDILTL